MDFCVGEQGLRSTVPPLMERRHYLSAKAGSLSATVVLEPSPAVTKKPTCGVEARSFGAGACACGVETRTYGVETRTCGVEARACGVETRTCGVGARLCGVETRTCGGELRTDATR